MQAHFTLGKPEQLTNAFALPYKEWRSHVLDEIFEEAKIEGIGIELNDRQFKADMVNGGQKRRYEKAKEVRRSIFRKAAERNGFITMEVYPERGQVVETTCLVAVPKTRKK